METDGWINGQRIAMRYDIGHQQPLQHPSTLHGFQQYYSPQRNPQIPPLPLQALHFTHSTPVNESSQYFNGTGRRKALFIGINYFGQRGQLRRCINDVKNMSIYLSSYFGYQRENMVLLTDDQHNPLSQPTKVNILKAMHWLVKGARPNDSLFFQYLGKFPLP
jgi:hypothetical protein